MKWLHLVCLLYVTIWSLTPGVSQAFPGDLPDRYSLLIGGTAATLDTQASLGVDQGGLSATLVMEDLFNLPIRRRFFRAEGAWRFGTRSYLDLGYVNIDRASQRMIGRRIEFGDLIFNTGALVEAEFQSRFVYAAYRHDFLQLDQVRIAGTVGVSAARVRAALSAQGGVTDTAGMVIMGGASEESTFPLPIPLIGIRLDWAIAERHVFQTYTRFIAIDLSNIRLAVAETGLRYFWHLQRNAAIGVGFDRFAINLPRYKTDDYVARFGYTIAGVSVYLKGSF